MVPLSVFTNQRRTLKWRLPEAGIHMRDLLATSTNDPILLRGSTVDVTLDGPRLIVHFCKSTWFAEGISGRCSERLPRPLIEFLCPVPAHGNRYSIDAELCYDADRAMPVLRILSFTYQCETPIETEFLLDDVHPADKTSEPPEDPTESARTIDLYGEEPALV